VGSILLLAWQYLLLKHREVVREITFTVDECCSQAKTTMERGRDAASAALEYERQVLTTVEAARRDARLAQGVKAIDFFGKGSQAWAALSRVGDPINSMTKEAKQVLESANEIQSADADRREDERGEQGDGSDDEEEEDASETIAELLVSEAESAFKSCANVDQQMKYGLANISLSIQAKNQFDGACRAEIQAGENAVRNGKALVNQVKAISAGLPEAIGAFERALWQAAKAKTLAEHGEVELARKAAVEVEGEARKVQRSQFKCLSLGRQEQLRDAQQSLAVSNERSSQKLRISALVPALHFIPTRRSRHKQRGQPLELSFLVPLPSLPILLLPSFRPASVSQLTWNH